MVVKAEFEKLGLQTISVELGEVDIQNTITKDQKNDLLIRLHALGFDLIDDKKSKIIEKIKGVTIAPKALISAILPSD